MLIKNDIKPVNALAMHLYFDDGKEKIDTVREDDILSITYRRDFKKVMGVGRVVKITNIHNHPGSEYVSAVISMDFSDKFGSKVTKIHTDDIIDFDKIVVRKNTARIGSANMGSTRLE